VTAANANATRTESVVRRPEERKGPCCSDADGTQSATSMAIPRRALSVRLDGELVDVPDEAVIRTNRIGRKWYGVRGYLG